MNFDQYQLATAKVAIYPGQGEEGGIYYTALGLGEAGEVQGKVKKIFRDDNGKVSETVRDQLKDELGDVLWYVSQLATELDLSLDTIASRNIEKLNDRRGRGVISGSGDNR